MFDRLGKDAMGRPSKGSRARSKAGSRLRIESLEGRSLMTASLAPIPSVTVEATAGYQVPLNGAFAGNTDPETFTASTDNPTGGVAVTPATGEFWTIGVSHASSGAGDPAFSGTMTFQLFQDLTPNAVSHIESLITGTVPFASLTTAAQQVIYPNGAGTTGLDYYLVGGNTFHRITNLTPTPQDPGDFIVQGGSIDGQGGGQVFATPYANETLPQLEFNGTGQLALANSGGTDSNDSQFFITTGLNIGLNATSTTGYTIFGQLVAGSDILTDLAGVAVGGASGTTPLSPVTITQSSLSNTSPYGVIHIDATNSTAGTQTNVTVTATDTIDHTQTSQTFPVFTIPASTLTTTTTTPPTIVPVASPVSTPVGTPATFQLSATNPTGGSLTYTAQGPVVAGAFTTIQNGSATVSASGLVTVTPNPGFAGPIRLVVGVQDGTNRAGTSASATSPANYSLQNVTVNVGSFAAAPTLNPVTTPINSSISQTVYIPLSATNPSGGQLSYIVSGSLANGTFTAPTNASVGVTPSGLVSVIPSPGFTGAIDLVVGVRDQTDRSGTGNIDDASNYNTQNIVINVAAQASTGAVRFIQDSSSSDTGNLIVTPLPQTAKNASNTIVVTQNQGDIQVIINGTTDLNQPAMNDVESIIVYGAKAKDRITVDPSVTVPVTLSSGTGGSHVLTAGGGPTLEQGWYGTTVEKQGESNNSLFGRAGKVTFVQGSGTNDATFAGTPIPARGNSRIRHLPPIPKGTFYKFVGTKLVKTSSPFTGPTTTTGSPLGSQTTTPVTTGNTGTTSGTAGGASVSSESTTSKAKKQ
jgi:cyclophilin family peptidyl-prolyl cis-trans isomerase